MGPEEIALALGLIQLARQAIPIIEREVAKGNVSIEKQKEILDARTALVSDLDLAFSGPEWRIDSDEPDTPEIAPSPDLPPS